jgi:hypothetical protein
MRIGSCVKVDRSAGLLARNATEFFLADVPVDVEMVERDAGATEMVLRFRGREFVAHRVD